LLSIRLLGNQAQAKQALPYLVVASLKQPRPEGCTLYVACVRTLPRPVEGWRWNEEIRDLGPPPDLHARRVAWSKAGEWPDRWKEYEAEYRAWMRQDPCVSLVARLEERIEGGERVALGCWCDPTTYCHAVLLGLELGQRCSLALCFASCASHVVARQSPPKRLKEEQAGARQQDAEAQEPPLLTGIGNGMAVSTGPAHRIRGRE
jgi:hypothetical protein